jgi:RecT family
MNVIAHVKDEMDLSKRRFGLVPENIAEAMKLADVMASAKLVPAALQKSPADCLMVIQQAMRWDMDPFAVAQECSVIQGKLMHSGKLVAAVVNARGNLTQRLWFEYSGEGDNRTITVSGQLQGEHQPRVVEVVFKNARTANSMWQKQPDQQLMYHGARVWARRHTPELMLGVWSEEEFDAIPVQHRRPPPPAPNAMLQHDPETGEVPSPQPQPSATEQTAPPGQRPAGGAALPLEDMAREAAMRGEAAFKAFYKSRSAKEREQLNAMGDELRGLMT